MYNTALQYQTDADSTHAVSHATLVGKTMPTNGVAKNTVASRAHTISKARTMHYRFLNSNLSCIQNHLQGRWDE